MISPFRQIFSLVRVFFSEGGQMYQWSPVVSYPRAVRANDETRNISVNLSGRAARFVKIQLFFSARWILISEIQFISGQLGSRAVLILSSQVSWGNEVS